MHMQVHVLRPSHCLGHLSSRHGHTEDLTTSHGHTCTQLLGVWSVLAWQQMGSPSAFCLAELGPGRGTLMKDLLRSTCAFPAFHSALQTHLVEVLSLGCKYGHACLHVLHVYVHEGMIQLRVGDPPVSACMHFFGYTQK